MILPVMRRSIASKRFYLTFCITHLDLFSKNVLNIDFYTLELSNGREILYHLCELVQSSSKQLNVNI